MEKDILIHPRKGRKEKRLPEQAIIIPNPVEAEMAGVLFSRFGVEERFLYNSKLLVDKESRLCIAGPCLGSPAAALVLEKLIVLGVCSVCVFSCCGAIDEALSIGDIVLGVSGEVGEGVSGYYNDNRQVSPNGDETEKLKQWLDSSGMESIETGMWSTDAPYRESRVKLEQLKKNHGIGAVDMEFTALCSIASFRDIDIGGLFIVSDELWGEKWRPGFNHSVYRKRSRSVLSRLITHKIEGLKQDEKNI